MDEPRQPKDPPESGSSPSSNPAGKTPDGVPRGTEDHEPKGRPTSDRARTESVRNRIEED